MWGKSTKFARKLKCVLEPIAAIDLVLKGLVVGIVASAPMGPVGVLTVQRTLNKGRSFGFVTGLGAAVSDLFYALVAGMGVSLVLDFIENPSNLFYLRVSGGVLLFAFGMYTFLSRPAPLRPSSKNRGTLMHNALTGFLITFSNPLILLLFVALFARFDFIQHGQYVEQTLGFFSILAGAVLWWFLLSGIVDKVRSKFRIETIRRINQALGMAVMIASMVGMYVTLGGAKF